MRYDSPLAVPRGLLNTLLMILNTIVWCTPLYLAAFLKLLVPVPAWRRAWTPVITACAEGWIGVNSWIFTRLLPTQWQVEGDLAALDGRDYLVCANHRAWLDIFVLQRLFNRRIPLLRFFIKQELLYFPVLGLAWWALDFPFVKRYSRRVLEARPELRGKDLEKTRRVMARFARRPIAILSFLEGTRFSPQKHASQQSPYQHLLKPRAGGLATAVNALNGRFHTLLDVTLAYPEGQASFWEFLCGRTPRIVAHVEQRAIPVPLREGDYRGDPAYREQFQQWVRDLWTEKDWRMAQILASTSSEQPAGDRRQA